MGWLSVAQVVQKIYTVHVDASVVSWLIVVV